MLTPRGDNQISVQEALAVILGLYTWSGWPTGATITIYVDNNGVRYSMIVCNPRCQEIALMVAEMWQVAATQRWGLLFRRVETKSNVADGLTRGDFHSFSHRKLCGMSQGCKSG